MPALAWEHPAFLFTSHLCTTQNWLPLPVILSASSTNVSCVVLLNIIKITCDQILPIIKMSKSKSKHRVYSMKTRNCRTIGKRRRMLTCLTIWNKRTNGSRFGKKMNKFMSSVSSRSFSIGLKNQKAMQNSSFDDMNKADLLRKGKECHCLD